MWLVATMLAVGPGCTGAPAETDTEAAVELPPAELLEQAWVMSFAQESSLGPYAAKKGWVSLVMKRDYGAAARELGPDGGAGAARAHVEMAFLYRQAALLTAHSLIEVYGKTPEPTDPTGAAHLLAVSYAMIGQLDAAKAEAAKLVRADRDPTAPWHGPWKLWLAGATQTWPPDLSGLPVKLPAPAPGEFPEVRDLPHYRLPERGGSSASREMADPGALLALAMWHDSAADAASPEIAAWVRAARAGYRLPVEPVPAVPAGEPPMDALFGSDLVMGGDIAFLAAVEGPEGLNAIEQHRDRSALAWIAATSRTDGKLDPQLVLEKAAALRRDLVDRASAKAGGSAAHHRTFADVVYVGALRSLALVAERGGDREGSGLLRINALEHSEKATACPVGLLALSAWDASNRYPMRAQDILHGQASRYPSIEIARYGLDVLGLRVGSERVGETPGM